MRAWISEWYRLLHRRAARHLRGKNAERWLVTLSFAESSFFPIPPDAFLAPLAAVRKDQWARLALLTTAASVLGALVGYYIGALFFNLIGKEVIALYRLEHTVAVVAEKFDRGVFLAMFLAAFTPIPFKVFTIAGGLFGVKLAPFLVASFLGRGLRFMSLSYLASRYGVRVARALYRSLDLVMYIFIAILMLGLLYAVVR